MVVGLGFALFVGLFSGMVGVVLKGVLSCGPLVVFFGGLNAINRLHGVPQVIGPVDGTVWSGAKVKKGLIDTLVGCLRVGMILGLVVALDMGLLWLLGLLGLVEGLGIGLVEGLGVGLVVGLFVVLPGGLVTSSVQQRAIVNGGLKQSAIYAGTLWLSVSLLAVLIEAVVWYTTHGDLAIYFNILGVVTSIAVLISLQKGGAFWIQNLTLRYLFARRSTSP